MIRGALLDLGNTLDKMGLQCSFYFRGIKSHFSNGPAPRSSHPWLRKLTCLQSQSVHWAKIKWQDVKATVAVDGDLNIIVDMIQSKVDHSPEVGSSSKTTLESPSKAIATCTMLILFALLHSRSMVQSSVHSSHVLNSGMGWGVRNSPASAFSCRQKGPEPGCSSCHPTPPAAHI
jgi:hypothetical protein